MSEAACNDCFPHPQVWVPGTHSCHKTLPKTRWGMDVPGLGHVECTVRKSSHGHERKRAGCTLWVESTESSPQTLWTYQTWQLAALACVRDVVPFPLRQVSPEINFFVSLSGQKFQPGVRKLFLLNPRVSAKHFVNWKGFCWKVSVQLWCILTPNSQQARWDANRPKPKGYKLARSQPI